MIEPRTRTGGRLDALRTVADAVLLEGYVLYPYRANAPKNRLRWSFGVVAPRAWADRTNTDRWWIAARFPMEGKPDVRGVLRFLRMRRRRVEAREREGWRPVESLEANGALHLSWDEGVLCELPFDSDRPAEFSFATAIEEEMLRDAQGRRVGRIVREMGALEGMVRVDAVGAGRGLHQVEVRVENRTPCPSDRPRDQALLHAALSTHLLLETDAGRFVSVIDPPPHARSAVAACKSEGIWPVLGGPPGTRDTLLAAPFILYDHPQVAPESPGDFCDATEIDELLGLRTATLTDEEKRIARATDPRAAAIVDRVDRLAPGDWERLHGARRVLRGPEMEALPERGIGPGSRVRLRPGGRRTDAQDLLFAGMRATVHRVERDLDGQAWLAVTLDDDPASGLHEWYGRFHYYRLDEVEPIDEEPA